MMDDPYSRFVGFNAIWVVFHLSYFSWYYTKYSACFHKLVRLDTLEKTELYEKTHIDRSRAEVSKKVQQLKKITYLPILGIALTHALGILLFYGEGIFANHYMAVIYVAAGAVLFLFLANKTQGAKVLGGKNGPFFRGPY